MNALQRCPVHPGYLCFFDGPPFQHNIRLKPGEEREPWPKRDYGFIYSITHAETSLRYVGYTKRRLSERWALHRSAAKREERSNDPLYRAMNQEGLHMFVMDELEQCGLSIIRKRELDYMRKLDSWNPAKGYNSPSLEAAYARLLYFSLNPAEEERYKALKDGPRALVNGWWEPVPPDEKWIEELEEASERSLQEGKRLMELIPSLTCPVIFANIPSE